MTIIKARELLGEEAVKLSDKQVLRAIETARFFANLMFDKIENMSPDERKRASKKT
jgi:hypothetical protein